MILLKLKIFLQIAQAAETNIYKIRTEAKAKPVQTLLERTYNDILNQALRISVRTESQVEHLEKYVKTMEFWMGWTETTINRTVS